MKITIEVACRDRDRRSADRQGWTGCERSIALAGENGYRVVCLIGDCQVGFAVCIEVAGNDEDRILSGRRVGSLRSKSAIPFPKENRNIIRAAVSSDKVQRSGSTQVSRRDPGRV